MLKKIPKKYRDKCISCFDTVTEAEDLAEELSTETEKYNVIVDKELGLALVVQPECCKFEFIDADGIPIHTGDIIYNTSNFPITVGRKNVKNDNCYILLYNRKEGYEYELTNSNDCYCFRHHMWSKKEKRWKNWKESKHIILNILIVPFIVIFIVQLLNHTIQYNNVGQKTLTITDAYTDRTGGFDKSIIYLNGDKYEITNSYPSNGVDWFCSHKDETIEVEVLENGIGWTKLLFNHGTYLTPVN